MAFLPIRLRSITVLYPGRDNTTSLRNMSRSNSPPANDRTRPLPAAPSKDRPPPPGNPLTTTILQSQSPACSMIIFSSIVRCGSGPDNNTNTSKSFVDGAGTTCIRDNHPIYRVGIGGIRFGCDNSPASPSLPGHIRHPTNRKPANGGIIDPLQQPVGNLTKGSPYR
jgi:hypothetical protein